MLKLVENQYTRPLDTMSIRELCNKWGFKYGYLYKWAVLERQIPIYLAGGIKLSEMEVLEFEDKKAALKYGRNKQKNVSD